MGWEKGTSGNPRGRPPHPVAARFRGVVEPQMDAVIAAMLTAAKSGDVQAARLLIERIIPALKPIPPTTPFRLDGDSLTAQAQAVLAAVAGGSIAVPDAKALIDSLATLARITEIDELEKRITALEKGRHENL